MGSTLILFGIVTFVITALLAPLHLLHIIPTKPFTLEGSLILIMSVSFALSQKSRQTSQKLLDLEREFRSDIEKKVTEKTIALEIKNQELNTTSVMKDKLFSILAHDLRNPLFALEEVIALFQDKHLTQKALKENINSLSENLENNKFLLENLLQWSYIQLGYSPLKQEEIDIQKLISESIQLYKGFALKKEISIQIKPNTSSVFYADEGIIRLVLRNLISNAIKFTPQKGKIQIFYGKKNSSFYFSVVDTGIGISKKKLKNLLVQSHIEKNTRGTIGEVEAELV